MLAAGWINLNLPSFFQVHNLLPVEKCHQKSCNIFRRGISGSVETWVVRSGGWRSMLWECPTLAAQLQNVTPWTSGSARILERSCKFSIIRYWWLFFPQDSFSLGEGKNPETTKSGMSQNDHDSGCWMIVVHWDAIPAFWFFVLVICKGMCFYFKELPQRSQKSNMFGHHSGWVAMMWNNLIPNRSCHPCVKRLQPRVFINLLDHNFGYQFFWIMNREWFKPDLNTIYRNNWKVFLLSLPPQTRPWWISLAWDLTCQWHGRCDKVGGLYAPSTPPKTNGWNLKIPPFKKEKHLETTNFLGSKCYISGVQFSSQQKKWEKLPSKSSWSHEKPR